MTMHMRLRDASRACPTTRALLATPWHQDGLARAVTQRTRCQHARCQHQKHRGWHQQEHPRWPRASCRKCPDLPSHNCAKSRFDSPPGRTPVLSLFPLDYIDGSREMARARRARCLYAFSAPALWLGKTQTFEIARRAPRLKVLKERNRATGVSTAIELLLAAHGLSFVVVVPRGAVTVAT